MSDDSQGEAGAAGSGAVDSMAPGAEGLDFRVLADAMPIMVWIGLPDGRIDYVNQCATDFFGRTRRQMRDEGWMAVLHPEDVAPTVARWTRSVTTGEPYSTEFRGRRGADGSYRWLDVRALPMRDAGGAVVRWLGSALDVHEARAGAAALQERLRIIERQAEAIRELSAPIIEVWEGVLTMPLLGMIDRDRAQRMTEVLLERIVARQCRYTIVDVTAVSAMDTETAAHIGRMLAAVRLLGAEGIVVGVRPEVAQTMVGLGLDLSSVTTLANLREGLLHCMRASAPGRSGRQAAPPSR